jgi:hypothetical protein
LPAVESRRRNSFLGSIALFTGLPALALAWFDFGGLPKVPVGPFELKFVEAISVAALLLAILSLILASSSRRTGTEIPLVAVLVCGGALGLAHFRHTIPTTPAPSPPAITAPVPAAKMSAPAVTTQNRSNPNHPPVASQAVNGASAAVQANARALQQQQARAALHGAKVKYDAARAAVIKSLDADPAYQSAKSAADDADEQLKEARLTLLPGHPDLVKVSQSDLEARDRLNQLVENAILKDPTARQALAQLTAAQEAVRR